VLIVGIWDAGAAVQKGAGEHSELSCWFIVSYSAGCWVRRTA